jgi:predicted acylesterase/phospholipase RssA
VRGLVLGGGGLDGIFANAGAVQSLLDQGQSYDIVAGTSAGALVATALQCDKLKEIEWLSGSLRPKDLVKDDKPFPDLARALRLIKKGHMLNASPLKALLAKVFPDEVLGTIDPDTLRIATFDLRSRMLVPVSPAVGPEHFRDALFASLSVPFVMKTVRVELIGIGGPHKYELTDGGVVTTHPVDLVLPWLWKARGEASDLTVVSTLSFKDAKDLPKRGLKRVLKILAAVKGGFVIERSNAEHGAAEEIGIRQTWIQVNTPNLYADDFSTDDVCAAWLAGYEAVEV